MSIAENVLRIEEQIQKACISAGRKPEDITLMAVSKFVPIAKIKEAFNAGIRMFGESRVKEAREKFTDFKLAETFSLQLIGSLQRNKAKSAVEIFDCIQSVDRQELITELIKHTSADKPLSVMLELHTGEETKSGFIGLDALFRAAEMILAGKGLKPAGLMTMAPYTADTKLIRSSFRLLAGAQRELEKRFPPAGNWSCLSMGMSNDFEIAIEEGSSLLRIGSALFKE